MKYYDSDGNGLILYEEFMRGLKDDLSERRLTMVKKVFASLDLEGSG